MELLAIVRGEARIGRWLAAEGEPTDAARERTPLVLPAPFARVHRSTIVNLDHVRELRTRNHRDYEAVLKDGTRLKLSRTHREVLRRG
jgi:hypothetical protein